MPRLRPPDRRTTLAIGLAAGTAFAAALAPGAIASGKEPSGSESKERTDGKPIQVALSPYAGSPLRTLKARIGKQERTFLLDTGGGGTVVSTKLAAELDLRPFGRLTGFSHDGQRHDVPRGGPVKISIGKFTRQGDVGVLDLDAMFKGLPPLGGIVSLETFSGQALTLDLSADRLWIETPKSLEPRTKDASELKARIGRQAGGAALDVFVAVKGKHGLLWFEIDSGSVAPVLIAPHALSELGVADLPSDATQDVVLDVVGLGAITCSATSKELIYDGLLNARFFFDHVVTFDLATERVWAKPAGKKPARKGQ